MNIDRRPAALGLGIAFLVAVVGAARARDAAAPDPQFARDSVALRVRYRTQESYDVLGGCSGPDWGWDTLTFRLPRNSPVPYGFEIVSPGAFRIGEILAPDSAWFLFRHGEFSLVPTFAGPGRTGCDSLVLTTVPSPVFGTAGITDASGAFQVWLVHPWPEPARSAPRPFTVSGRVVDDRTGEAARNCEVYVDRSRIAVEPNARGEFRLDLPAGDYGFIVCGINREPARFHVHVPTRPLTVRLARSH